VKDLTINNLSEVSGAGWSKYLKNLNISTEGDNISIRSDKLCFSSSSDGVYNLQTSGAAIQFNEKTKHLLATGLNNSAQGQVLSIKKGEGMQVLSSTSLT